MSQTRLLDFGAQRRDDEEVLALIASLPKCNPAAAPVSCAGLLNEGGELYREVQLYSEYEMLQFMARMNANGFIRMPAGAPYPMCNYESVFAKP